MKKTGLTPKSMVFMAELLDCMLDEIDYTIYSTCDPELLRVMEYEKQKLTQAFIRLQNLITIRRYDFNE